MPQRVVFQTDGVAWLRGTELDFRHAVVTSLPDLSGLPELGLERWRRWFIDAAAQVCSSIASDAVAIFYQTDIKHDGVWIDKAHLVQLGADAAGVHCLWHKIVCRVAPGTVDRGRPGYGHWLAFSRGLRLERGASSPDVLPELGEMTWSRATPMTAAAASCVFIRKHTGCQVVVDPFCGRGTILAVANNHGFDAVGVEIAKRRAQQARKLVVAPDEGAQAASGSSIEPGHHGRSG